MTGGLLTHPWKFAPEALRATEALAEGLAERGQCPREVCDDRSSKAKTEVRDAAMEVDS